MKTYPLTIKQCVISLREKASNIDYAEIEGLLTWSVGYLEQLSKKNKKLKKQIHKEYGKGYKQAEFHANIEKRYD